MQQNTHQKNRNDEQFEGKHPGRAANEAEGLNGRRAMKNLRRWRARKANGKVKGAWNPKWVKE